MKPIADEVLAGLLVLHRVDPRSADLPVLRGDLQRPPRERVDHAVERLGDLPHLLDAELPHLRLAALGEVELLDRRAGDVSPAALGEHRRLRLDVGAGLEVAELLALLAAALVAGAHADDAAILDDQLRGGGLGEDVGAGLLGHALLVARHRGDRDHLVAVVVLRGRRRDADLGFAVGQYVDRLLLDFAEGEALFAPLLARQIREELLQRPGAHHRAGEVVPAAGLRLLDHRDRHFAEALHRLRIVAEQLQQAVGAGETRGAAADDRHADLDQLVLGVEAALDEFLLRSPPAAGRPRGRHARCWNRYGRTWLDAPFGSASRICRAPSNPSRPQPPSSPSRHRSASAGSC